MFDVLLVLNYKPKLCIRVVNAHVNSGTLRVFLLIVEF